MLRKKHINYLLIAAFSLALALCATSYVDNREDVDALMRSKVDALNKASFKHRYSDAKWSETYARKALRYIEDSLPNYYDGRLRAWNNIATSY